MTSALFPTPSAPWYNRPMRITPETLTTLTQAGLRLAGRVLVRDHLHLGPALISVTVAARLRSGLRAVEAYLRRLILLLALQIEHTLKPDPRERPLNPRPKPERPKSQSFPLNLDQRPFPENFFTSPDPWAERPQRNTALVPAAPYYQRLMRLKALLEAPEARARRLAWHLARRRPGPLLAPFHTLSPRLGLEVSAMHKSMGHAIVTASRNRPPSIGPPPRPPPRIHVL
ncbi:MAG: hypothetical protein AAGF20_07560 [Pseudomonadota bacterium]